MVAVDPHLVVNAGVKPGLQRLHFPPVEQINFQRKLTTSMLISWGKLIRLIVRPPRCAASLFHVKLLHSFVSCPFVSAGLQSSFMIFFFISSNHLVPCSPLLSSLCSSIQWTKNPIYFCSVREGCESPLGGGAGWLLCCQGNMLSGTWPLQVA